MKTTFWNRVRGYVTVEVRGDKLEQLLNAILEKRMQVWDLHRTDEHTVRMQIVLRDFFRLRPLLRKTKSKAYVKGRFGLPFLMDKLGKRKTFAVGIAVFVLCLYMLSSLVWRIDVEGNVKVAKSDILQIAREQGLYRFQWKFRMKEPDMLSRAIHAQLQGVSWVGVEIRGTKVQIKVVESTKPDKGPLMSPRNLVASHNATVTEIFAEAGKPVAKVNSNVKKGDVLISGIIGDDANRQVVVARGGVRGIVWQEAAVETPLLLKQKVYTGETKTRSYLVIGNRGLQLSGFGKLPYEQYEIQGERKVVQWRDYRLPFGWLKETVLESRLEETQLTQEEGEKLGLEQARSEVLAAAGKDAVLRGEKILLHEKSDNGKVYMKVLFEIEMNIAVEQPIVN